jgi:predicted DNA-binding transcriptional regulator AlpA
MSRQRLAGLAEVAELLGVTKRSATRYAARADFPEPLERLASGPVWARADVERWATQHMPLPPGRPPRER